MKQHLLFVHSAGNQGPDEGSDRLLAYLRSALDVYCEIHAPRMPDPDNPRYELWKQCILEALRSIEGEVILVGHSLGGSVLLKLLSEEGFERPIKTLFLVATPFWGMKDWEIEEYMLPLDFEAHLPNIAHVYLYHSREDEWVPFSHMAQYAKKLPAAHVRSVSGGEHEFFHGLPALAQDLYNVLKHGRSI